MPDFSSYLESVGRHYEPWCRLYTPIDAVGQADRMEWFDFGFMVQTIVPQKDDPRETGDRAETIERFMVLEGLRKYAGGQVLLVGRPGSGKSTALTQLLLEEVLTPSPSPKFGRGEQEEEIGRVPVLVELRYWNEDGVMGLIRSFLVKFGMSAAEVDRITLEGLLRSKKLLLLMDGLNELPSEAGRQDVRRFRREFSGVAIVFTTRDLSVGGDFGIEKKLEMQPLTESQMKAFVMAYLPEQSEAMLRQLGTRLREFGSTPLLLWMLCGLFRQTGEIPANLGGVFRAFTTGYERNLKADVVVESDRRWWSVLLQELAARMMIGDGSVEFRVAIDRAEVEAIFTEYLRDRETLAAGAATKALDDLLRHHLIQANGVQVEFRHQLIQEYYAAEWLLVRVGGLDDATLQQEFLNYLKWTEPVALMLALVEDEALAVRVVALALEVDLMLGARLAGEVRSELQRNMIELVLKASLINKKATPEWLKIKLLGKVNTPLAAEKLSHFIQNPDLNLQREAVWALQLFSSEIAIPYLINVLHYGKAPLQMLAIRALAEVSTPQAISIILSVLSEPFFEIRSQAVQSLGYGLGRISTETISKELIVEIILLMVISEAKLASFLLPVRQELKVNKVHPWKFHSKIQDAIRNNPLWEQEQSVSRDYYYMLNEVPKEIFISALGDAIANYTTKNEILNSQMIKRLKRKNESDKSKEIIHLSNQKNVEQWREDIKSIEDPFIKGNTIFHAALDLGKESISLVLESLEDLNPEVHGNAAKSITYLINQFPEEKNNFSVTIPILIKLFQESKSHTRLLFIDALGALGDKLACQILKDALSNKDRSVFCSAMTALLQIECDNILHCSRTMLKDSDFLIRGAASAALRKSQGAEVVLPELFEMICSDLGIEAFGTIQGIQASCKFYNYEIQQAKLRKADRPSLEGGGGDRSVVQNFYGPVYGVAGNVEGDQIVSPPPDLLN